MFKTIHPNRWFFWAIAIILIAVILLWWAAELYSIEQDSNILPYFQTFRPQNLSTLDGNIVLPPDPGDAGKATLAGIDSDGDGVRDDVQRYIALTYPNSAKTRAALIQMAEAVQTVLLKANNKQIIYTTDEQARLDAVTCLDYVFGTSRARKAISDLFAQILNTSARNHAFILANNNGGVFGEAPPLNVWKTKCAFDPDSMEN